MSELNTSPIFRFYRGHLIFGAERKPILILSGLCLLLLFLQALVTTVLAVAIWCVGVQLLRLSARADEQGIEVFLVAQHQQRWYPSHARKNFTQK
ncbi:MAG: VirB3 family type IV secretion system protein [Ferrimonas sp.]